MRHAPLLLAFGACLALPVAAQETDEPQRQLGTHAHGAGKLGIAIEQRSVEIELEAPGSDIVGFEHAARTAEQKQAVAQARAVLAKSVALFKLPVAAGCKQTSAKVKLVGGGSDTHGHKQGHGHGKDAKTAETAPHSEFHAEYKFTCARPELIQSIEIDYFKSFPRAESLEVTLIGPAGQSKHKASKNKPRVDFKGTGS